MSKKINFLVFDTETTGLPILNKGYNIFHQSRYPDYTLTDLHDRSRMISICWLIYETPSSENNVDKLNQPLVRKYFVIKPNQQDPFEIRNSHIHNITQQQAISEGVSLEQVLHQLEEDLQQYQCQHIVGHNVLFDQYVLRGEMYRSGNHQLLEQWNKLPGICTMKLGQQFYDFGTTSWGAKKVPKMIELHQKLFNKPIINPHHAESDAYACGQCYQRILLDNGGKK